MLANRVRIGSGRKRGIPGSSELIAGNLSAGFYGEVPMGDLITGDELASIIGLDAGISQYSDTAGWIKCSYEGNVEFIAKKPLRYNLNWTSIDTVGAAYGTYITIKGYTYKVRLLKGANKDPTLADTGGDIVNSEWNRLILPMHIQSKNADWTYPENIESSVPHWGVDYTDADLLTHMNAGHGTLTWCQELVSDTLYGNRISRGLLDVSHSRSSPPSSSTNHYGWRPVLELDYPPQV